MSKIEIAAGILINDEKKFLLYLRDDKKEIPYPNCWALLGGHVEKNETLIGALKRELLEEISYPIQNPIFIGNFNDLMGGEVYTFKIRINKKIDELILYEGQKLSYFCFEEIMKINTPKILKDFLFNNREKIFKD